jgi:hypothetical protein
MSTVLVGIICFFAGALAGIFCIALVSGNRD